MNLIFIHNKVMGICIWSPRLDDRGNSHRGIQFFSKMTEKYSLSIFDQIWSGRKCSRCSCGMGGFFDRSFNNNTIIIIYWILSF